jgi:hypothetical protein
MDKKIDRNLKEISEFFNVSEDALLTQPIDLLTKMVEAADDDDTFKLHHLGYSMNSSC